MQFVGFILTVKHQFMVTQYLKSSISSIHELGIPPMSCVWF